jgi:Fic family protein
MPAEFDSPPIHITPLMLNKVADIAEWMGRNQEQVKAKLTPHLRRNNRIRTIQASLQIENNTLSVEQVTAIVQGKRILGDPKEIHEVRNAFSAYEHLKELDPHSEADFLATHARMTSGLIEKSGAYRRGGVGIYRDQELIHLAPPAVRVPFQMRNLLAWLAASDVHPLITSCVFHYECSFIHPFADGNGRMARLWQTLILCRWQEIFAHLPVETLVRDQVQAYYEALAKSDQAGNATAFSEWMLHLIETALRKTTLSDHVSDQASDHVSDHVKALLELLEHGPMTRQELMTALGLKHKPTFRKNYLTPALEQGLIELTEPDKPRSPTQAYRLISE